MPRLSTVCFLFPKCKARQDARSPPSPTARRPRRAACDAGQLEVVQALLQPPTRAKAKAMRESGTSTQRAPHIAVFAAARGRAPELRALHDAGAVLTLPLRRLALLLAIDLGCQAGVELALGWSEAQGCAAAEPAAAAAALVAFCEGDALAAPPSKGEQELVLSAARNKVEFADCYYPKDARSPDPRCPLLRVCFAASSKFPARPLCPDEVGAVGRCWIGGCRSELGLLPAPAPQQTGAALGAEEPRPCPANLPCVPPAPSRRRSVGTAGRARRQWASWMRFAPRASSPASRRTRTGTASGTVQATS